MTHAHPFRRDHGWLEVICGCMYSGKTETMILRLRRFLQAGMTVVLIRPHTDDREADMRAHSGLTLEPHENLFKLVWLPGTHLDSVCMLDSLDVLAIDEAQFFGEDLKPFVQRAVASGVHVEVAGLDLDYLAQPFERVAELLPIADNITKTLAFCACGNAGRRSHRLTADTRRVVVGGKKAYAAQCTRCFSPPAAP